MAFLEAQSLGQVFQTSTSVNTVVFESLNFQIEAGEFVSFLGPSGCGKSTLLRILGELEKSYSGKLISKSKEKSFVFQEPRLLPWRNCLENTLLPLEIEKSEISDTDRAKAEELLVKLHLGNAFEKFPHELSGGMKMRNALARALAVSPDFLLLDEPFAALDETTRLYLQEELRLLFEKSRWTIAFVTHSIEEACFLSDRIFIFSKDRKKLIEHRTSLPALRKKSLRDEVAYFEEVKKIRHLFETEALK